MLFSDITSSVTRERAELMRDLEYIREDVNDTPLQESLLIFESCGNGRLDFTVGSALDLFGGSLSFEKVVECAAGK